MAQSTIRYEFDLVIRKTRLQPTVWTGEKNQEPNKTVLEELHFNKISVAEAIKKLSNYIEVWI